MYSPVSIEQLSKAQISRLLNGHSVRVRHHPQGKHVVHLSKEQHKKIAKAHAKGGAINLTFDPYQQVQHQHLRGEGVVSVVKSAVHHAMPHVRKYAQEHIVPGAKKFAKQHLLPRAKEFLRDEGAKLRKPAERLVERALQPVFGEPLAHDLAVRGTTAGYAEYERGLEHLGQHVSEQIGEGVHRRRGRPRGHKKGGKLTFGKVLSGIKKVATSKMGKKIQGTLLDEGLKMAQATGRLTPTQASLLKKAGHAGIAGEGVRHMQQRMHPYGRLEYDAQPLAYGGAMFPAGGALYPSGY